MIKAYLSVILLILFFNQSSHAKTITLPIEFDQLNVPYISLNLTGTPQPVYLDLGSREGLHIPKEMMAQIAGLELTGKKRDSIDLAGNKASNDIFIIKNLDINGMIFNDVDGVEMTPWGLSLEWGDPAEKEPNQGEKLSVVAGLGLFANHRIVLDYQQKLLFVDDKSSPNGTDDGWVNIPFQLSEEGLIIQVTDNNKTYKMALDSGASHSILKSDALAREAKTVDCREVYPEIEEQSCQLIGVNIKDLTNAPTVNLIMINKLPDEFNADGLLGTDFIEKYNIMIDLSQQQIKLKPI